MLHLARWLPHGLPHYWIITWHWPGPALPGKRPLAQLDFPDPQRRTMLANVVISDQIRSVMKVAALRNAPRCGVHGLGFSMGKGRVGLHSLLWVPRQRH